MTNPASPSGPPTADRRGFLQWLTALVGVVAAAMFTIPFVGYLLGPMRRRKPLWVTLGKVEDFQLGETRLVTFANPLSQPWDGMTGQTGVYVRYYGKDGASKDQFMVLAMNCAHLGCPVSWFPQSGLFLCPCHGGVYYADGTHASGPPPRGLFHCEWEVTGKGELRVQAPHYPTLQDTLIRKEEG